jgi:AcrR family transcriptional regulator
LERNRRKRRAIGRPAADGESVGREALIACVCAMLSKLPPNKITRAEVARHLNVDPSLIRYYFRDRVTLLLAAAERLTAEFDRILEAETRRAEQSAQGRLLARVSAMLKFEIAYPFFHRLIMDDLPTLQSAAANRFLDELTQKAMAGYGSIVEAGVKEGAFRRVNSAFLFLTIIGMCEFFVAGLPIVRIALGKEFDERAISGRYREFISELLLHGIGNSPR